MHALQALPFITRCSQYRQYCLAIKHTLLTKLKMSWSSMQDISSHYFNTPYSTSLTRFYNTSSCTPPLKVSSIIIPINYYKITMTAL